GVRHRREYIGAVDVLLDEGLLVGRVAVQDDRMLEKLGNLAGAARIALDELDLVGFLECFRETEPDVAPTRDDDALHRVFLLAHLAHYAPDVVARSEKEHFVTVLDDSVALGAHASSLAIDCDDTRIQLAQMLGQLT